MSLRFSRRFKLLPGVCLNLSKSGISTSIGGPGVRLTFGRRTRATIGVPGSGLSYSVTERRPNYGRAIVLGIALGFVLAIIYAWITS